MSKYGVPLYRRAEEPKRVLVTVECEGKPPRIKKWRGKTVAGIRRAAKKAYPGCRLRFGVWF